MVSIAFLRAVNVGGRKLVMADLCALVAKLGHTKVKSILQSGTVVFATTTTSAATLERSLEAEIAAKFTLQTDVIVRTAAEWNAIVAANPFPNEALDDPGHLVVMVLKDAPAAADVRALQAVVKGREQVRAGVRCLYITYPDGIGDSKLTIAVIERALKTRGTARNWNTALKIAAAAAAAS